MGIFSGSVIAFSKVKWQKERDELVSAFHTLALYTVGENLQLILDLYYLIDNYCLS